jgi:hypothetical protein
MKKDTVNDVVRNLNAGNMKDKDFALTVALQNIESKWLRNDFVWDLTIEETHEFFANGILVHNCIDGGRYCFMELYSAGKGAIIGMRAF